MRKTLLLILVVFTSLDVHAEDACIQYQRQDNTWGSSYRVPGDVLSGDDLNDVLNTYRFSSFQNYIIVRWPNGGYSLFEVPGYLSSLPYTYRAVRDQNGRSYRVKTAPRYGRCSG